jgi:hypothetical protein
MKKLLLMSLLMLSSIRSFADRYTDEYQPDPSMLSGTSGADDNAFAFMFFVTFIGAFVVADLYKSQFYTPIKEVIIFILICLAITYLWLMNN